MPEPTIERYEVIIPTIVASDLYGNITVKTTEGKEIKVNKKHGSIHQLFHQASEDGRALKLGFAVYLGKEYVHTAEFYDGQPATEPSLVGKPPVVSKPMTKETTPESQMKKKDWAEKDRITRKSIEKQTALKEAVAIACAIIAQGKEMSPAKVIETAKLFEAYLEGKEVQQKSRLEEEAKKMGATEIKEGG